MCFCVRGIQFQSILKNGDGFFWFTAAIERQSKKIADQEIRSQLLLRDRKLAGRFLSAARSQKHLRQSNVTCRERIAGRHQVAKNFFRLSIMSGSELCRS